jgi:hypothetical protein
LAATLLVVSCVLVYPSYSNAQDVGPNGGTIISEETEIENLGNGLEKHTTTTVEQTETENGTVTTPQMLKNRGFESSTNTTTVPDWTTSGSVKVCDTCGPFGGNALQTGPETAGGTASQTIDLFDKMNQQEINKGFTMNYGAHVFSHQSNATVPACDSTPANGPDCRDTFSITLDIKDSSGTLLHKFEHKFEEITFTGWDTTNFFFESSIPKNEYTSALATLELFGIDSGFPSGTFGPAFDNVTLTATHTDIIIQQITTITEELIQTAINTTTEDTITPITEVEVIETELEPETEQSFEITISDGLGDTIESFEISIDANMEVTIEPISTDTGADAAPEIETTVAEVESQIEAEIQTAEAQPEPEAAPESTETESSTESNTEPTESEPESTESTNNETETETTQETTEESKDDGNGGDKNNGDGEQEPKKDTKPSKPKSSKSDKKPTKSKTTKEKSKEEKKKEIATKVVTKIIEKLGTDAASQATQLALMNAIGANIAAQTPKLQDASKWYSSKTIYTTELKDPTAVLFTQAQGALHNQLMDSQYK